MVDSTILFCLVFSATGNISHLAKASVMVGSSFHFVMTYKYCVVPDKILKPGHKSYWFMRLPKLIQYVKGFPFT